MTVENLPAWMPLSVAVWLVQMVSYHAFGLMFEYFDRTNRLSAYKVRPADRMSYGQILPRVLLNQTFILLPAMMLVQWIGLAFVGTAHVGWVMFLVGMVGMTVGHDVVQYLAHRYILHRPNLMRKLGHSVHHSTTASRGISACFMSPADFFLEIACPYLIPLILIGGGGSDVVFHFFVVGAGAFGGIYEHSGFDFSVKLKAAQATGWRNVLNGFVAHAISSKAHAEHHSRGNVSFSDGFGSSNICDTVLETRWDLVKQRERRRPDGAEGGLQEPEAAQH